MGRGIRFTILAYLGFHYGRHIVDLFARYYWPILLVLIAFSVLGALCGLLEYKRGQKANDPGTLWPGVATSPPGSLVG